MRQSQRWNVESLMSVPFRRIAYLLGGLALAGCQNHLTGAPPTAPWFRLTREGRDFADRRAHPPPPSQAFLAWSNAIGEINLKEASCAKEASAEKEREVRERKSAACAEQCRSATRDANDAYERGIGPAGSPRRAPRAPARSGATRPGRTRHLRGASQVLDRTERLRAGFRQGRTAASPSVRPCNRMAVRLPAVPLGTRACWWGRWESNPRPRA